MAADAKSPAGRFDLVTLDLDGTLLPGDTAFAVVLRAAGRGDEVAASDRRFFAGEQTLQETFWEQWAWVKDLTPGEVHRALRKAEWLPGIRDGVARLKAAGLRVHLLTDQPTLVTDFLARWDLTQAVASPTQVHDGRVTGIEARFDKWDNLRGHLAAWGVPPERVCHVGNGANDVPVWNRVGAGVAVFAEPGVAAEADLDAGRPSSLDAVVDGVLRLHRGGK